MYAATELQKLASANWNIWAGLRVIVYEHGQAAPDWCGLTR